MTGALSGIRVLDLSRVLAGPYCTSLLSDLGAEVIKVEQPGRGDDARSLGPFRDGESVYFALLNRGKRSITLNLRDPEGVRIMHELIGSADVLVENFRPGVTERLGLSYEELAEDNPGLVYLSISGFGQTGPLARTPAYDLVVQGMSGVMAATGFPDGPPTRVGESLGDLVAGVFGAWSITAALLERERTGRGTHLDAAMFECLIALQVTGLSLLQVSGQPAGRVGNRHPVSTPFDTYQAADGPVVIAVANESIFQRLAALIDRPDLTTDPRFAIDESRTDNEPALREIIEHWTSTRTVEEIVALTSAAGVPSAPIWDLDEALASAQSQDRELEQTVADPRAGAIRFVPQPVRFDGQRVAADGASPGLGQDTEAILGSELGLSAAAVAELRAGGVI